MDTVFTLTPAGIIAGFLAICGGFTTVCVAGGWAVKIWKAKQAPSREIRKELAELKDETEKHSEILSEDKQALDTMRKEFSELRTEVRKHGELLDNDNKALKQLQEGNHITQKALLALLAHGIDGNDVSRMKAVKAELEDYLINRH